MSSKFLSALALRMHSDPVSQLLGTSEHGFLTLYVFNVNVNVLLLGFASIYGHRVSEIDEMFEARKMIGICPQSDMNFDVLTVEENLSILASVKGIPANNIIQEVCYSYISRHCISCTLIYLIVIAQ